MSIGPLFRPFLLALVLHMGFGACVVAQRPPGFDHADFDSILARFVDDRGRVDYAGLKKDREGLDRYVARLGQLGPATAPHLFQTRADSLAYWINAYNAFVLHGVVEAYPVSSVLKISLFHGFFKRKEFRLDGRDVTLDHIEHETIRTLFGDPRIHAAVNCGAKSCPRLSNEAFVPERLEDQLQRGMEYMVGSPEHVRLDRTTGELHLSRIFDWFESDFTTWFSKRYGVSHPTIVDYIQLFCDEDTERYLEQHPEVRIRYNDYDWSLNERECD